MAASRYVLRDIHEKELDPRMPYREVGNDGRLTGDEDFRRVLQELEEVTIGFEKPAKPIKGEKPTGKIIEAISEIEVVVDGVVLETEVVTERNVDATPVADPSPGSLMAEGGEEIILASSKKIKAQKAKETKPSKPTE